jgi:hypothetical protein
MAVVVQPFATLCRGGAEESGKPEQADCEGARSETAPL